MNKNIICFLGCKGTGKDYNSELCIKHGYIKMAFADPLREIAWKILGYTPDTKNNLSYADFKNCILTSEKPSKLFKFIPWYNSFVITSVRKILQNIGSVFKELFGETYWSNLWYKRVLDSNVDNIVCTDARFTYEIKKVLSLVKKGYAIKFVWCQYENANWKDILKDKHESEALAQFIYFNRDKYNLYDGCIIGHDLIRKIIKEFEKQ